MVPFLLALLACRSTPVPGDTGGSDDGGSDDGGSDDGEAVDWCIDFEGGNLEPVGYSGTLHEAEDGGLAFVVTEGDDWSALVGEEALELPGEHALVLRSSHAGDPLSAGEATTASFTVESDHLWLSHLSEVGDEGVQIAVELLDPDDDVVLGSLDLPADNGGFVPALQPQHDPIPGYPEITWGDPTPGSPVQARIDVSAFRGQQVRLRLRQHTTVQDNGFFTLFDDLCAGTTTGTDFRIER